MLEDTSGRLLDPSVIITLDSEGYLDDDDMFILANTRNVTRDGLRLVYEVLPDLELTGLEESEPHLRRQMLYAMHGQAVGSGTIYLDVRWRSPRP